MRGTELQRIRCVIMRGGTSKGVFVNEADLPVDPERRNAAILGLMGTPDPRQIDGLGGSDPLTSKFAIIGPPSRPDADVDYTFVQVGVAEPTLDYLGVCGNISAAVGPYAIQEGLVRPTGDRTTVRIHQVNTGRIIVADVPTAHGDPDVGGDTAIDGVPGTGAALWLDFADAAGAASGRILPTGSARDTWEVPGLGAVEVSLVDLANPVVYVRATALGLTGTEGPEDYVQNPQATAWLEYLRGRAAVELGWIDDPARAAEECSLHPLVATLHEPASYRALDGSLVEAGSMDVSGRVQVLRRLHLAYPGSGAANLTMAAFVPGSLAHELMGARGPGRHDFSIGHPSGLMPTQGEVEMVDGELVPRRIAFVRTARRIMEGYAYVPHARIALDDAIVSAEPHLRHLAGGRD